MRATEDVRSEHDRQVAERAWDEALEEARDRGWLHPESVPDVPNPYRKEQS